MARPRKAATGVGERIESLIPEGVSVADFSEKIGVSDRTLGNYIRGDREPSFEFLERLRKYAGIDLNWIVSGEGGDHSADLVMSNGDVTMTAQLKRMAGDTEETISVARYSAQASAGDGAVVLAQEVADYFRVGRDWLERYMPRGARTGIIEAKGDSMEPTIRDGDILLLNFDIGNQDIANGGVFVITIDGNLFVKRLQIMLDGSIVIRSDNARYEPERVDREYADEKMLVHARVVWAGGPLR